jgi:hypothetical protein
MAGRSFHRRMMVKVDLQLFVCLLPCEWTALWDKVEPILRDEKFGWQITQSLTHCDGFRAHAGLVPIMSA